MKRKYLAVHTVARRELSVCQRANALKLPPVAQLQRKSCRAPRETCLGVELRECGLN